ncbi:MAG: rod shape-determining protein MreC [Bacteroidetes bacterium RIFOXYA12_FULL_35_11]|nr:MAG: rod shape-determining protein MreC [Bacteroidetes bacterium GWF2_35_48]OFY75059.1 MAG: rod shape-determining protein MreC [Bacteroidetes bacterium RIFOXYA12_FULL_35_11]OFY97252.1 MAG: rod shape-determining protein MreC [Bacteroidetes bacterium RIFOXYB2_FULL_35_7]OFZ03574.1 MAG: rod shape-determining protein MreC [Bacteroidetes bacterium RIFOXYC12_FULL_35_7]
MNNLIRFIFKHYVTILFILLEALSFFLLVQNNKYQRTSILNTGYEISGFVYSKYNEVAEYFSLRQENQKLAEENASLRNQLFNSYKTDTFFVQKIYDTLHKQQYIYKTAKVVHNSTDQQNNYIIIDKGLKHGITPDMAVISSNGVVGIVKDVTENFASVISLLNSNVKISAKIKRNSYFGSVSWEGSNYKKAAFNEIPVHIKIQKKDTVITSGYSTIFPEGIMIGRIEDFSFKGGDNFYQIQLDLSTDFKGLNYVYVVYNLMKEEKIPILKNIQKESKTGKNK